MIAYPLEKLGDVYRTRGEWALSRAAYEEAVAQSEASGDLQGLVPALAGLARVLVADEPEEAERLVARALEFAPGMNHVHALLAAGWVALARGRPRRAPPSARRRPRPRPASAATAARWRSRSSCARSRHPIRAPRSSGSTRRRRSGATCGTRPGRLGSSSLPRGSAGDDEAAERRRAPAHARSACAVTVRPWRRRTIAAGPPAVAVQSLGRFRLFRDGAPVPLGRVAIAEGPRPAEDPRRSPGASDPARRPHGGALAGPEPRAAREPSLRAAQHRARASSTPTSGTSPTASSARTGTRSGCSARA